jgi:hypothetical protein
MKTVNCKVFILAALLAILAFAGSAGAGFINFESGGYDGEIIFSSIPGLEFTNTAGYDWLYADWRTDGYNGPYPNYDITFDYPLATQYYSVGNFFAWMGTDQGVGVITFTQSYATYFQIGYSTYSGIDLVAYDDTDTPQDWAVGVMNVGTGQLDYLRVEAPGMAYVTVSGTNNEWLIDNLSTDALQDCLTDDNCDDGDYCNGAEKCINFQCTDGQAVICHDDNLYCNGEESCSSADQACVHSGNPCPPEATCDEAADSCSGWHNDDDADDDTDEGMNAQDDDTQPPAEDDDAGWPEGKVTGGCCGG